MKSGGWRDILAFVRDPKRAASLIELGIEPVAGNLLDPKSISRVLMRDCATIIHLAHGESATVATRNLIEGACRAGVQRFVHISSVAVHGPTPGPDAAHEATAQIRRYADDYCNSKAEQEEIVRQAIDHSGLRGVILRPTVVYGPGSNFVKQVLAEAKTGTVTVFDEGVGLCNAVFVDDVCDAIQAALVEDAAMGKAIFINADRAVTWKEFILNFANFIQPRAQVKNISSSEALDWWLNNSGQRSRDTDGLFLRAARKAIRMLSQTPTSQPYPPPGRAMREVVRVEFSNAQARHLLRWVPKTDFVAGVAETRKWFDSGSP